MMNESDLLKRQIVQAEVLLLAARLRDCEARLQSDPSDKDAALELIAGVDALKEYTRELRDIDRRLAHIFRGLN